VSEVLTHKLPIKHRLDKHIADVAISSPANNQVLTYDSTSQKWQNKDPSAGGQAHNVGSATGTTDINTTSSGYVDMPDMSVTLNFSAQHRCLIFFSCVISMSLTDTVAGFRAVIDGSSYRAVHVPAPTQQAYIRVGAFLFESQVLASGSHTFKIQWRKYVGTGTVYNDASLVSDRRMLLVIELVS